MLDSRKSTNCRLYELLSLLGIENRLYDSSEGIMEEMFENIDYERVYQKLEKMKKKSRDYLINSLNDERIK